MNPIFRRVGRARSHFVIAAVGAIVLASCSSDGPAEPSAADDTDSTVEVESAQPTDEPSATDSPSATDPPSDEAAPTTDPDDTFDPYAQTIEWSECEFGECAEAVVPIDYDDPSAGTTTIALSRVAATGADPIGTLFVNPGGPGASGLDLPLRFESDAPDLLAAYDVVGFDPRGVGQSDPLGCLGDAELDELRSFDVDPDDPESLEQYRALSQGQGEACLATNPELAQHVTTVETAMDLDVVRELVGDDRFNYLGFSYGTFLGTNYAALFPDKVGRMVLDGPEDPALSETEKGLSTLGGFQLAFDDFAADCVAEDCPLGASVEEIEQNVVDMFETAKDEPLPTDDTDRSLTRPLAFYGIAAPLYSQELWPELTEALSTAFEGDGTTLLALADEYLGRVDGGYPENTQVITAINCLDAKLAPPSGPQPTEDDFVDTSPVFGAVAYAFEAVGCEDWPIDPTVTPPDYSAPGAAPIVVIGTTGDPATPFENAGKLADELESGVLLVRVGEGHTAYFSGNRCIAETVDAYLVDGTVPEDAVECEEESVDEGAGQDVALIIGEDLVLLEWSECTWDGSTLTLAAEGSGVEANATTVADDTVEVVLSGTAEGTINGTVTDVDGTVIMSGTAVDDSGADVDATLSLDGTTCTE